MVFSSTDHDATSSAWSIVGSLVQEDDDDLPHPVMPAPRQQQFTEFDSTNGAPQPGHPAARQQSLSEFSPSQWLARAAHAQGRSLADMLATLAEHDDSTAAGHKRGGDMETDIPEADCAPKRMRDDTTE